MSEQFQETFITKEDKQFLDSIDRTLDERDKIDENLEQLCEEIPRTQNAIRMLESYVDYYESASAEDKFDFRRKLEQIIERDEGPNSFLSRVAATFLEYINDDSEYEEYDIDEEDY